MDQTPCTWALSERLFQSPHSLWIEGIYLLNKPNFKLWISTLLPGRPGPSHLGQPGPVKTLQTGEAAALTVRQWMDRAASGLAEGPLLQTVLNNWESGARADGSTQPASARPPSAGTVWISYTSICTAMNTNTTNLRLTAELWHPSVERRGEGVLFLFFKMFKELIETKTKVWQMFVLQLHLCSFVWVSLALSRLSFLISPSLPL